MHKIFYRKQKALNASLFCLWMMGVLTGFGPAAQAAMDPVMIEPPAKPKPQIERVAMVLPFNPDRLPLPIRKPTQSGKIVAIKADLSELTQWATGTASSNATVPSPTSKVITDAVQNGKTDQAFKLLNQPGVARSLSVADYDRLRVKVASGFMAGGDLAQALALSRATLKRSGRDVPMAGWVAGLSAWRLGDMKTAFTSFAVTASSEKADDWVRAGAAFWASRAAEQLDRDDQAKSFRVLAAQFDRTFYGQLALAQLDKTPHLSWDMPGFTRTDYDRIKKTSLGQQVITHLAAGRLSAADQSLMKLAGGDGCDRDLRLAILGLALREGLPATALKLASTVERDTGVRYDAAYYPFGSWMEDQDFRVDRALVHAIIRQESSFNPRARSGQGAVGLMQLMPSTATYVIKVKAANTGARDLTQSTHNLDVGQHYVEYLQDHPAVNGNLLNLLVAYNAGPGNLSKWQKQLGNDQDPLLFIESIPSAETRAYVERVMASYWIYRARLGMPNPTLTALSQGQTRVAMAQSGWFAGLKLNRLLPL